MPTRILYIARNDLDHTVTLAIDSDRWEYFLPSSAACDTVEYLCKRVSHGKALAFAKRRAIRTEKVNESADSLR